jgi:hypothetical protein
VGTCLRWKCKGTGVGSAPARRRPRAAAWNSVHLRSAAGAAAVPLGEFLPPLGEHGGGECFVRGESSTFFGEGDDGTSSGRPCLMSAM